MYNLTLINIAQFFLFFAVPFGTALWAVITLWQKLGTVRSLTLEQWNERYVERVVKMNLAAPLDKAAILQRLIRDKAIRCLFYGFAFITSGLSAYVFFMFRIVGLEGSVWLVPAWILIAVSAAQTCLLEKRESAVFREMTENAGSEFFETLAKKINEKSRSENWPENG